MVISMDRWVGKVAIVTGASAGIGAAICEQLVTAGVIVVGFARRKERIDELAAKLKGEKGKLYGVKVDITKESDILDGFKWVGASVGDVHILINNAGVSRYTNLMEGDTKLWREVLDTNVLGVCIATREACRVMKANQIDGHIIHINSLAGHWVPNFPICNVYAASKYAITALTQQIRHEFNDAKLQIKITSISPGMVETELGIAAGVPQEMLDTIKGLPILKSEEVADAVTFALSTGPNCMVQELMIRPVLDVW